MIAQDTRLLALAPPLSEAAYARYYALRKAASTQTRNTTAWLCAHARALTGFRPEVHILSIGTGEGDVDLALHEALGRQGARARFTAVEPSPSQRALLEARLWEGGAARDFTIRGQRFEELHTRQRFDLVLLCQSAYYFDPAALPALLRRAFSLVASGGSLVIAHQSGKGIPELQAEHMLALKGSHEAMLDGDDIAGLLERDGSIPYLGHRDRFEIPAALEVSRCLDPDSPEGLDIMSFCLECELRVLPGARVAALRSGFARLARAAAGGIWLWEPVDIFRLRQS